MKKLLVPVLLLFISVKAFPQGNDQLFEMINTSFLRYAGMMADNAKTTGKRVAETNSIPYGDTFVAMDNYPLGFEFSNQIKDLGFQFIFLHSKVAKKIMKKPRSVIFMAGPHIDQNSLTITFSSRNVAWVNGGLNITVSDWAKYIWQYSCDAKEWKLVTVDSGGI